VVDCCSVFSMTITVKALNQAGSLASVTLDRDPDHCPICLRGIEPKDLDRAYCLDSPTSVERVFQCPRVKCGHLFIARYRPDSMYGQLRLHDCVPFELGDDDLPTEIEAVSKDFCLIFNEAHKAERFRLLLIAGPGYRKSLEFLIKDYACKLHPDPDEQEKVKKMELGACIQKYMKNDMVRETARRAAWLGNDETHYLRKWEGKDLQDLKDLLQLVVTTIHSELLFDNMKKEMPKGKT
jgi:hypothetical protein